MENDVMIASNSFLNNITNDLTDYQIILLFREMYENSLISLELVQSLPFYFFSIDKEAKKIQKRFKRLYNEDEKEIDIWLSHLEAFLEIVLEEEWQLKEKKFLYSMRCLFFYL